MAVRIAVPTLLMIGMSTKPPKPFPITPPGLGMRQRAAHSSKKIPVAWRNTDPANKNDHQPEDDTRPKTAAKC